VTSVYVVDDDRSIGVVLEAYIKKYGCDEVVVESDPLRALAFLKDHHPDLIISDVSMPGLDGYSLVEGFRKYPHLKHTPVVFLSARKTYQDLRKSLQLGVNDYLFKPFKGNEIEDILNTYLSPANLNDAVQVSELLVDPPSIVERYQILEQIGEGGSAVVYRGFDTVLERDVAIKKMSTQHLSAAEKDFFKNVFVKEAKTIAGLKNPYIIDIYDLIFYDDDAGCSIIMELIDGDDLNQYLKKNSLTLRELLDIFTKVATGLIYAHEQGIVHRDIKPENILIAPDVVKITDFGLAHPETTAHDGQSAGTLTYMAPEQLSSQGGIDIRSDIYAFGALMYYALTGKTCFESSNISERIERMFEEELELPHLINPKVPVALSALTSQCVCIDKERRYATMNTVKAELDNLLLYLSEEELKAEWSLSS
jgi:CheY-like chemotaxis protein/tRNA A-37 threonylcarbamoyl transferase component Bud32